MNRQYRRYVFPKGRLTTPPAAVRSNVERVGLCCLDVNRCEAGQWKGREGDTWGTILIALGFGEMGFLISVWVGDLLGGVALALGMSTLFASFLVLPFLSWRNNRPLRFNRRTGKIYYYDHRKDRVHVTYWDGIRAYLEVRHPLRGSPIPLVNIEFPDDEGGFFPVALRGTQKLSVDQTDLDRAAELWEYIRLYMEEGPEHLPPRKAEYDYPDPTVQDFCREYSPFQVFKSKEWGIRILWEFPLFLLGFLLAPIFILTDILYLQFEKHLSIKPYPPQMLEACNCREENVEFIPDVKEADREWETV